MIRPIRTFFPAFLAALALAVLAAPSGAQSAKSLEARIQSFEHGIVPAVVYQGDDTGTLSVTDRMDEYGIPGLSIAVIENGEILFAQGYGVTDFETKTPVTPDTLFLAGSISKPVAATGALRLVQEGKLALDLDVNQVLKAWKVPPSDELGSEKITLRHLLTHTAGLTVHGFGGYNREAAVPTVVQILNGEEPANSAPVVVDLEPGTEWRYSGGGYTVMQLMVEETAGQPFEDYLKKTVLEPFGMNDSTFSNPLPEAWHSRAAAGYYPGKRRVKGDWHTYPEMAAAGLWTTASDLARFAIGIQGAAAGTSDAVLNQGTATAMLQKVSEHNWGLGPSLSGDGESRRFGHGGRDEGFDAQLTAYVSGGRGAALLINANDNNGFTGEVMEAIARAFDWPDYPRTVQRTAVRLPKDVMKRYTATYEVEGEDLTLRVYAWKDALWVSSGAGSRLGLVSEGKPNEFFVPGVGAVTFEEDEDGEIAALHYEFGGSKGVGKRKN